MTALDRIEQREDEVLELRNLWLSRLMFGWIVGPEFVETRSFNQFLDDHTPAAMSVVGETSGEEDAA